jgi:hypothetical protein
MPKRGGLKALRNLIVEANDLLATTDLPQGRSRRASELLQAAITLAGHLLLVSPAAALGSKGGKTTAKRMTANDPEYYKRIAAMRKTQAGGRPKSKDQ